MPDSVPRQSSRALAMLAALAGALLLSISAHAQETKPALPSFDNPQQVEAWLAAKHIPALGLGVIHHGQLQSVQVYGERQHGEPASVDTVFNVASVTKTVTSALVLKLASQGQWDIDAPLAQYWTDPDVKDDPRAQLLTTRHVLNHQSGFPNWRWQSKSGKLAFEAAPGTRYGYSGEGFEYLRHALEAKFHQPLEQLASAQIFQPLGMHDTHFTWNAARDAKRIALPHDAKGNALAVTENTEANAADLLKTTVADYGRFLVAILHAEGISKDLYAQMTAPAVQTRGQKYMGLGWELYTGLPGGETALSHGGSDPGVQTLVFLLPASREGLIIFTNSDNGTAVFADLIAAFLKDRGQAIIDIEMGK
jgi:CubicO group peptidase (beta-lactamase class C family)